MKNKIFATICIISALLLTSCSSANNSKPASTTPEITVETETTVNTTAAAITTPVITTMITSKDNADSLMRSELETLAGKIVKQSEDEYQSITVRSDDDSLKSLSFFVDFSEGISVEETVEIIEVYSDMIITLENATSVSIYWFESSGDFIGSFSALKVVNCLEPIAGISWSNDKYKEAYELMHQNEETTTDPKHPVENILYESEGIKIIFKGLDSDDSLYPYYANLYIENNTSNKITVQLRDESINGFMIDFVFSEEVAAGKKSNCKAYISKRGLADNGIKFTEIKTLEFKFSIYNKDLNEYLTTNPITIKV